MTSNYSAQYEVTFNRFSNKLELKLISRAGAPKAYPNMYLNTPVFLDTIKTSGYSSLSVYFDPEYLKITDSQNNDLGFLPLDDPSAQFKMQIINTDFQQSQEIKFDLDDRRRNKNTSNSPGGGLRNKFTLRVNRRQSGLR